MCMEDIKIGYNLRTSVRQVTVPAASNTVLCEGNQKRVFLAIYSNGVALLRCCPQGLTPGSAQGFTASIERPFLEFPIDKYGNLTTDKWTAEASAGSPVCFVVESILEARSSRQLQE